MLLHRRRPSPCESRVGSCDYFFEACSAFTSRYGLHARGVASATLSIEGSSSFVASTTASIATGWSEPVPERELHPLKSSAFSRRTFTPVMSKRSPEWRIIRLCQCAEEKPLVAMTHVPVEAERSTRSAAWTENPEKIPPRSSLPNPHHFRNGQQRKKSYRSSSSKTLKLSITALRRFFAGRNA